MIWQPGLGALALIAVTACGQPAQAGTGSGAGGAQIVATQPAVQSHGAPVRDHVSFVDYLRGQGRTVEIVGDVQQPFLRAKGTTLRISGGDIKQPAEIQSYNYDPNEIPDAAKAAAADAQNIGPDGNPRTMMITWVAPPHFYRKERVIVIYLGSDPAALKLLTDALGPQFAGR